MVIGAPGATRIITSVVQVILNVLDFGMSVGDAVHAPRQAHVEEAVAQVSDRDRCRSVHAHL